MELERQNTQSGTMWSWRMPWLNLIIIQESDVGNVFWGIKFTSDPTRNGSSACAVSNTGSEHDTTEETDGEERNEIAHVGCIGVHMNLLVPTTRLHGPRYSNIMTHQGNHLADFLLVSLSFLSAVYLSTKR